MSNERNKRIFQLLKECIKPLVKEMIEQGNEGWLPAEKVKEYNPDAYHFEWNKDYTMFRPHKLKWTDDSSYAKYQGGGWNELDEGKEEDEYRGRKEGNPNVIYKVEQNAQGEIERLIAFLQGTLSGQATLAIRKAFDLDQEMKRVKKTAEEALKKVKAEYLHEYFSDADRIYTKVISSASAVIGFSQDIQKSNFKKDVFLKLVYEILEDLDEAVKGPLMQKIKEAEQKATETHSEPGRTIWKPAELKENEVPGDNLDAILSNVDQKIAQLDLLKKGGMK